MASYVGGMKVGGGYYWNPRTWEVHVLTAEGGVLPGSERAHFLRIPFAAPRSWCPDDGRALPDVPPGHRLRAPRAARWSSGSWVA